MLINNGTIEDREYTHTNINLFFTHRHVGRYDKLPIKYFLENRIE